MKREAQAAGLLASDVSAVLWECQQTGGHCDCVRECINGACDCLAQRFGEQLTEADATGTGQP